jgi:hypothetical protein
LLFPQSSASGVLLTAIDVYKFSISILFTKSTCDQHHTLAITFRKNHFFIKSSLFRERKKSFASFVRKKIARFSEKKKKNLNKKKKSIG